jgi:hypothetical protein
LWIKEKVPPQEWHVPRTHNAINEAGEPLRIRSRKAKQPKGRRAIDRQQIVGGFTRPFARTSLRPTDRNSVAPKRCTGANAFTDIESVTPARRTPHF